MKAKLLLSALGVVAIVAFVANGAFAQEKACCGDKADGSGAGMCEVKGDVKEAKVPNQTECPVMAGAVNKEIHTDYNGKRIYFCCEGCVEAFNKEPEKYLKALEEKGVVLADAPIEQTVCPVSGKPINKEVYTDHNGERVYFCCENCKAPFEKNPEKYLKKLKS